MTPLSHGIFVRVTHALRGISVLALLGSGWLILLAHPRLYWGEDGYFGGPAFIDLPLAANEDHITWARGLHFLAAWILVLNGFAYLMSGLLSGRLVRLLLRDPRRGGFYPPLQRLAYSGLMLVLLPVLVLSGLTMSPAVTAAWPELFWLFAGRQSARTVHFLVAAMIGLFTLGHVLLGLQLRGGLRSMTIGRAHAVTSENQA